MSKGFSRAYMQQLRRTSESTLVEQDRSLTWSRTGSSAKKQTNIRDNSDLISTGFKSNRSRLAQSRFTTNEKLRSPFSQQIPFLPLLSQSSYYYHRLEDSTNMNSQTNKKTAKTSQQLLEDVNNMKGFHCVDYRSRERHTGVGQARKRALSGQCSLMGKTVDLRRDDSSDEKKLATDKSKSIAFDQDYFQQVKAQGTGMFRTLVTQFKRVRDDSEPDIWNLKDENRIAQLLTWSTPKKIVVVPMNEGQTEKPKADLSEEKWKTFISRLSEPRKQVPWPTRGEGEKEFDHKNSEHIEYINNISLPRRMAVHGHKKNFVYSTCNCSNADDFAGDGRNLSPSINSSGYYKIQSFFYQNSKAIDDGLFYPPI